MIPIGCYLFHSSHHPLSPLVTGLIFYDTKVTVMNRVLNATVQRTADHAAPEITLDPLEIVGGTHYPFPISYHHSWIFAHILSVSQAFVLPARSDDQRTHTSAVLCDLLVHVFVVSRFISLVLDICSHPLSIFGICCSGEIRSSENTYLCQAARQLSCVPSSQLCVKLASGGDPTYAFNIRFTGEEVHGTS